jgi:hypothetical protein
VRDVAGCRLADREPEVLARFNGKRAVFVAAPEGGQNILEVRKRVDGSSLPSTPRCQQHHRRGGFDQAENVGTA